MKDNVFDHIVGRGVLKWDAVWRVVRWLADPSGGHGLGTAFRDQLSRYCFGQVTSAIEVKIEFKLGKREGKEKWVDMFIAAPDVTKPTMIALIDDISLRSPNDTRKIRNLRTYADLANIPMMQLMSILSYNAAKHLGDTGLKMMQERGRIQKGMVADIVVFDPERFTDNSTYDKGSIPSTGMKAVIVNGPITVSDDKVLPVFAGQPIRFEPEAKPRFQPISLEGWNNEFSTGMPDTFTGAIPKDGKR